jgi:Fe-S cluster assembly iron-binding protein IscA
MALDEPKDTDKKFDFEGMSVVVDKELLETTGGITIDYQSAGWRAGLSITPKQPLKAPAGAFSCGGDCGEAH